MKRLRQTLIALIAIIPHLVHPTHASAGSKGCHDAVNFLWPASSRAWAHKIVKRESGGNPGAQNRSSTAAGCFQILRGTWNGSRVGVPWERRYDPVWNVWVAMHLYRARGAQPWSL